MGTKTTRGGTWDKHIMLTVEFDNGKPRVDLQDRRTDVAPSPKPQAPRAAKAVSPNQLKEISCSSTFGSAACAGIQRTRYESRPFASR